MKIIDRKLAKEIKSNPQIILSMPAKVRCNKSFLYEAILINPEVIPYIPEKTRNNFNFLINIFSNFKNNRQFSNYFEIIKTIPTDPVIFEKFAQYEQIIFHYSKKARNFEIKYDNKNNLELLFKGKNIVNITEKITNEGHIYQLNVKYGRTNGGELNIKVITNNYQITAQYNYKEYVEEYLWGSRPKVTSKNRFIAKRDGVYYIGPITCYIYNRPFVITYDENKYSLYDVIDILLGENINFVTDSSYTKEIYATRDALFYQRHLRDYFKILYKDKKLIETDEEKRRKLSMKKKK